MTVTHLLAWVTGLAGLGLFVGFLIATAKGARRGSCCGHQGGVSAAACLTGAVMLGAATSIFGALR